MLKNGTLYYFSPTGGTKKVSDILCQELFEQTEEKDLRTHDNSDAHSEVVVFATPVFAGRVPAFVSEQLKELKGNGKKAITLAVYGNRHYDDALLELNTLLNEGGFQIIASAALLAQHSIVPEAGKGRPDTKDIAEIKDFAANILAKWEDQCFTEPMVPGNFPYREVSPNTITPISLEGCVGCGTCAKVCPVNAISIDGTIVTTNVDSCFLCMACTAACPTNMRILPPPAQAVMNEKLAEATKTHRDNEFFLSDRKEI